MTRPMTKHYNLPADSLLLLGPTGVGKSPLGDFLAARGLLGRACHHLDFGSELRSIAAGGERAAFYAPKELEFISGVLERGLLLENEHFELAEKIIAGFLDRAGFTDGDLLVLNGIPRHAGQAKDIPAIAAIHGLIILDCTAEDVYRRIHNNVGGDRTERVDDGRELIAKKLQIFRERTAPLIDYYGAQGRSLYRVSVTGEMTTEETYDLISRLAAAHPPIALVAEPPKR